MAEYKIKIIELNGNRKLQNACKKAGIELFNPQGAWNGYGYEKLPLCARITSLSDMRKFNKLKKEIEGIRVEPLTEEQKMHKWSARLAKLTGISIENALEIAREKLDYKQEQIDALEAKQCEYYSVQRAKLIRKIERENPLRYIQNCEHAEAILIASNRHKNSDYEAQLSEARELAERGDIDFDDVKFYARSHTHYYKAVE